MTIYRYPQELGSDEYPHMLRITVHKRVNVKISDNQVPAAYILDETARGSGTAGGRTASASTLQQLTNAYGSVNLAKNVSSNAVLTTVLAAGLLTVVNDDGEEMSYDIQPTSDATIYLPPVSPKIKYETSWSQVSAGFISGLPADIDLKKGTILGGDAVKYLVMQQASQTNNFLGAPATALQQRLGRALNPFIGQTFGGNKFRTFDFAYKFLPKNKKEAEQIENILKVLKRNMLGTYSGTFIGYPSEFKLAYMFKNNRNSYIESTFFCALTTLDINYGDGTDFVTFSDGFPSEINVSMSFIETQIVDSDSIPG